MPVGSQRYWRRHYIAAKANGADENVVAHLEAKVTENSFVFSTISPEVIVAFGERYPLVVARFEYTVTHRAALTNETMMMMARSARTAQGAHDLEMQFDEFRSIGGSYDLLACTSSQLLYRQIYRKKRQLQSTLPELGEWQHMNENVSKISDNYIGDGIVAFAEGKERHVNQWCEQNILAPEKVEMDHHCKRSSCIRQSVALFSTFMASVGFRAHGDDFLLGCELGSCTRRSRVGGDLLGPAMATALDVRQPSQGWQWHPSTYAP